MKLTAILLYCLRHQSVPEVCYRFSGKRVSVCYSPILHYRARDRERDVGTKRVVVITPC